MGKVLKEQGQEQLNPSKSTRQTCPATCKKEASVKETEALEKEPGACPEVGPSLPISHTPLPALAS